MDNLDNSSTNEAAFQQNFIIVSSGESGSDVTDVEFQFDDDVFSLYSSAESGSSYDDEFSLNLSVESISSNNESGSCTDRRGPDQACPAQIPRQDACQLLEVAEILDYLSRGHPRSLPTPDHLREKDGHFPEYNPTPDGQTIFYKRCTVCLKHGKRKKTKFQCDKCEVPLCIFPCFKDFHKKINF